MCAPWFCINTTRPYRAIACYLLTHFECESTASIAYQVNLKVFQQHKPVLLRIETMQEF